MPKSHKDYIFIFSLKISNFFLYEEKSFLSEIFYTGQSLKYFRFRIHLGFSRYLRSRREEPYFYCYLKPENNPECVLDELICYFELLDENSVPIVKNEINVSPYEGLLEIGSSRIVSPFKICDVLSHSKLDTIIIRCGLGLHNCPSIPVEWHGISSIETESYSFKWITDDYSRPWKMNKTKTILQTNVDITLDEKFFHIDISFKFQKPLNGILVCRLSFQQNDDELYGIRSSKNFKCEDFWQFPKIEIKILDERLKENRLCFEGVRSFQFQFVFWSGTFCNVIKEVSPPLQIVEKKSRRSCTSMKKSAKLDFEVKKEQTILENYNKGN